MSAVRENAVLRGVELTVVRGGRRILDTATVTIVPGTVTAVLGPNGSGKSTLLRVLTGLWRPASGSVGLDGEPLDRLSRTAIARRIAFLPQDTQCDFAFTVEEIVAMGRHPHLGAFGAIGETDRRAIEDAIVTCDLDRLRARTIDRLSGGERQRAVIARCLAAEPKVLLFDEPTAHLDLEHALSVLTLCRTLAARGTAVVFATHDLGNAARFATDVVLLRTGRVVATGAPAAVLTPARLRDVFAVDTEIVITADGHPAFVFSTPDAERDVAPAETPAVLSDGALAQGAHR